MQNPSKTRLFDLYNAILMKSLKITQSKRGRKKLPMVERCERRGIITKAMRTKHKLEIKLEPTANYANSGTILAETYTLNTSLL